MREGIRRLAVAVRWLSWLWIGGWVALIAWLLVSEPGYIVGERLAFGAGFGGLGLLGLAAYAWWERVSTHPMTPPRLVANRPFLGFEFGRAH